MQAPSPTQAIPSHARTSSMTGYQNSTSFSTETPLGSAATNINLVGCDVPPATTGLPRFRKAVTVVPEGIEVRSHHCSIFSEYSYGKDIGHVERPAMYVVPQMVFHSVKPEQVDELVLAHFTQLLAEEDLRCISIDASRDVELDRQEQVLESVIARAEAELRVFKPLGGGNWRKGLESQS